MARTSKILLVLLVALLAMSGSLAAKPAVKAKAPAAKGKAVVVSPKIDRAALVKLHGYASLLYAATWALETFGLDVPLVGFKATLTGFDGSDPLTQLFVRFLSCAVMMVGLAEIEFAGNAMMQKYFVLYHVPLALTAIAGIKTLGQGPMAWLQPTLIAAFGIGSLL